MARSRFYIRFVIKYISTMVRIRPSYVNNRVGFT